MRWNSRAASFNNSASCSPSLAHKIVLAANMTAEAIENLVSNFISMPNATDEAGARAGAPRACLSHEACQPSELPPAAGWAGSFALYGLVNRDPESDYFSRLGPGGSLDQNNMIILALN